MLDRPNRRTVLAGATGAAAVALVDRLISENRATGAEPPAPVGPVDAHELWYEQPAKEWAEALPVGNGRLGAMIFGGTEREHLQLNEDTLWAGGPYDPVSPDAKEALVEARKRVFAGKYKEAAELYNPKIAARPLKQMPYQTVGDLFLDFHDAAPVESYRRSLDLDSAVQTTRYTRNGTTFTREVFATAVDQLIVIRLSADKPGQISFDAHVTSPQAHTSSTGDGNDTIVLGGVGGTSGDITGAVRFEARVRAFPAGGTVSTSAGKLIVDRADSVVLLVSIATSYKRFDDVSADPTALNQTALERASTQSFEQVRDAHVADHRSLFTRVRLDLGTSDASKLPTDERIKHSATLDDPTLATLYFHYARYLLIACSRPGTQPANLQGVWNDLMSPPWGSKYTININTEMNYWPAEPTNLADCVEPLVRMVEELSVTGARTANAMYGARGWVCHHNTDLWRASAPIDGPDWGMWPTGGAWLCKHLFDHYDYGRDVAFLKRVYPLLKGASEFFVDTLVEHPTQKWLVTCPSISPENMHPHGSAVCAGPTMDSQIIRDLFDNTITSAGVLGVDGEFVTQLKQTRERLAPTRVGNQGQIQEWLDDWDADAPEQTHRHISHLYGLFPSAQIDPRTTPDLAEAAKVTLNTRGDVTTGWAIAWRINCWARLRDGDRALKIIRLLLDPTRTYLNMFDAHPPFQIDGNFGGASGITEMLLQSHAGEIDLLPALPKAWPRGSFTGLRARGGVEVDAAWDNATLTTVTLRTRPTTTVRVRAHDCTWTLRVPDSGHLTFDPRESHPDSHRTEEGNGRR